MAHFLVARLMFVVGIEAKLSRDEYVMNDRNML